MSRLEEESGESVGPTQDTAVKSGSVVTVSTSIEEGFGCILVAVAAAILLWALLTFGVPLWLNTFGG